MTTWEWIVLGGAVALPCSRARAGTDPPPAGVAQEAVRGRVQPRGFGRRDERRRAASRRDRADAQGARLENAPCRDERALPRRMEADGVALRERPARTRRGRRRGSSCVPSKSGDIRTRRTASGSSRSSRSLIRTLPTGIGTATRCLENVDGEQSTPRTSGRPWSTSARCSRTWCRARRLPHSELRWRSRQRRRRSTRPGAASAVGRVRAAHGRGGRGALRRADGLDRRARGGAHAPRPRDARALTHGDAADP